LQKTDESYLIKPGTRRWVSLKPKLTTANSVSEAHLPSPRKRDNTESTPTALAPKKPLPRQGGALHHTECDPPSPQSAIRNRPLAWGTL